MSGTALIPARGGSRRVPRKNVRPFLGVPAIARVVGILQDSGVIGRIIISTDDPAIATIAREAGAEVPGLRPSELADDHTSTIDVVRHALRTWLADMQPDAPLWVVYPTALLITPDEVRAAEERFAASDADFLATVLRYRHPVERRLRTDDDGLLVPEVPAALHSRTQDLQPAFHDAGQFYIGRTGAWNAGSPLESRSLVGHELGPSSVVDIDEPSDWSFAELIARTRTMPGREQGVD